MGHVIVTYECSGHIRLMFLVRYSSCFKMIRLQLMFMSRIATYGCLGHLQVLTFQYVTPIFTFPCHEQGNVLRSPVGPASCDQKDCVICCLINIAYNLTCLTLIKVRRER